ncbi:hypothetical protein [Erythrobacter sp. F6033]|uniref:hypothetical protein n=1 Tax=Erythrobacter sp. F6033 TaxID=2926401 RepID=UPI001FF21B8B|nr:hypothetical protein [Erythrobacter sp. F6033]MCK0128888.1 hypothetical protein [Erythrobacter sp. F6033]
MTNLWVQFELLSDAAQLAITGGAFWVFAAFCALMERRRNKARNLARLERVGFMPWTTLFVLGAIIGGGCLAMSLPVVLGSLL